MQMLIRSCAVAASLALLGLGSAVPQAVAAVEVKRALDCANAVDVGLTIYDQGANAVKGSGSWTRCDNSFTRVDIQLEKESVWPNLYFTADRQLFDPADFGSHAYTVLAHCANHDRRHWVTWVIATIRNWKGELVTVISKTSNTLFAPCNT
ncbi:hypothetical protein AB0G73_28165 [Streptomyces sp. NPDC020719]|uniref:hypothetical protein n=1 Tax=Streptomyces sp. NPDC020719 TaxID=3154896 RepID=UPI0033C34EC9